MCDIMTHERRRVKNESLDNLSARRAKSVSEPAAFVLVNKRIEGALWKNQRFSLLELPAGQASRRSSIEWSGAGEW
jgi:hypothetical protein